MQAYQQFAVYALRDKQPVFTDSSATQILRTVDRNTRLNVIRREGPHYMVRVLNQVAFVSVDDVSADRTAAAPTAKFGDWATSGTRAALETSRTLAATPATPTSRRWGTPRRLHDAVLVVSE